MNERTARLLVWAPRILGIGLCAFLALFALDALGTGDSRARSLREFAIHLLPALLLLVVVAVAWRRQRVGGVVFVGLAVAYAVTAQRLDWILVISGPLCLAGLLFFWSAPRGSHPSY